MPIEKKTIDQIFITLYGVVGFILFAVSANSFSRMNVSCTNPFIYNGMVGILVFGGILMTVALSYMFCNWRGGDCYNGEHAEGVSELYLGMGIIFSLILTMLLLALGVKLKDSPDCMKNGSGLRVNIWFMFTLCLILFVCSATASGYIIQRKEKFLATN